MVLALQEHSQIIYTTTYISLARFRGLMVVDYEWPILNPILSQRDMSHRSIESLK